MKKSLMMLWLICAMLAPPLAKTAMGGSPLPPVEENDANLSAAETVFVNRFQLEGNTAFSNEELEAALAHYENRMLTAEELHEAKNRLTRHYIANGYVNSGAVLPDQEVNDGVVRMKIIEGRLTKITFTGLSRLRERYVRSRLLRGDDPRKAPLNMHSLRRRLKLLKQDPRVENVNAELTPGLEPGEARLRVSIVEAKPWRAALVFNNQNPPSVGPYRGELEFSHMNLTGWGDALFARYAITEGVNEYLAEYAIPVTRWDTTLTFAAERVDSTVVARPFGHLDITSETTTLSGDLSHPFIKTLSRELILGLRFEYKRNKTFLLDEPFSFSGSDDGEYTGVVLGFTQQWVSRTMQQVVAIHSSVNVGVDALDALARDLEPDGRFISWRGQFQWIRLLETLDSELLLRASIQISDDPLPPAEKISLGGFSTVRGYRENQMTTDGGVVCGVEWRIPATTLKIPGISRAPGDGVLQLAPFFDYGRGWNRQGRDPDPADIYSVGLGARWRVGRRLQAWIYWGRALKKVHTSGEYDIQDDGISFQIASEF